MSTGKQATQHESEATLARFVDAFNEWSYDALAPLLHPEVDLRPVTTLQMPDVPYRGPDGVRDWMEQAHHRLGSVRYKAELVGTDDERMMAKAKMSFQNLDRRRTLDPAMVWWVLTFRDGLLLCENSHLTFREACADMADGYRAS